LCCNSMEHIDESLDLELNSVSIAVLLLE
jgi:hypothetical protein